MENHKKQPLKRQWEKVALEQAAQQERGHRWENLRREDDYSSMQCGEVRTFLCKVRLAKCQPAGYSSRLYTSQKQSLVLQA